MYQRAANLETLDINSHEPVVALALPTLQTGTQDAVEIVRRRMHTET